MSIKRSKHIACNDLSDSAKQWISSEITSQLRELKEQLNREIVEDLKIIHGKITNQILGELDRKVEQKVRTAAEDVKREVEKSNNQLALTNTQQIVAVKQATKELVMQVGQQITNQVYGKVLSEINEKVVPKVNNMVEYVNYKMQDGGEINDSYRRAVHAQSNPHLADGMKMITDGKNDKQIISPHCHIFFSEDD